MISLKPIKPISLKSVVNCFTCADPVLIHKMKEHQGKHTKQQVFNLPFSNIVIAS